MKEMFKLGIILALYATAACVGLAFVYSGTQRTIAEREQADLEMALKELFPGADRFEDISGTIPSTDGAVSFSSQYSAFKDGRVQGVAVRASAGSYGGPIIVLAGVGADGKISGVKILENPDTPGLGANASLPTYYVDRAKGTTFYGQFSGKSVGDPFEAKNDVAAITASTITSRAVSLAVKVSGEAAYAWLSAQGGSGK
ncbi:FMN-binding protein [Treponema sp. OttesenSCG-928-L16]|nr:FMN-binding protein [Treponema sp. OttesenSCG-928-L16]